MAPLHLPMCSLFLWNIACMYMLWPDRVYPKIRLIYTLQKNIDKNQKRSASSFYHRIGLSTSKRMGWDGCRDFVLKRGFEFFIQNSLVLDMYHFFLCIKWGLTLNRKVIFGRNGLIDGWVEERFFEFLVDSTLSVFLLFILRFCFVLCILYWQMMKVRCICATLLYSFFPFSSTPPTSLTSSPATTSWWWRATSPCSTTPWSPFGLFFSSSSLSPSNECCFTISPLWKLWILVRNEHYEALWLKVVVWTKTAPNHSPSSPWFHIPIYLSTYLCRYIFTLSMPLSTQREVDLFDPTPPPIPTIRPLQGWAVVL